MDEFDPGAYAPVLKGNKFEDFTEGQVFEHHWGRTFNHSDNTVFSAALCYWKPMQLNVEYAKAHGHSDVVINPMLVLCTVVGLSVEDLSESGGPFLGVDDCTFHAETYPNDTVVARSEVLSTRRSSSRPSTGIVTWRTEAHNQRDELVLSLNRTNLVAMRGEQR